jgi:hypothetical protein
VAEPRLFGVMLDGAGLPESSDSLPEGEVLATEVLGVLALAA